MAGSVARLAGSVLAIALTVGGVLAVRPHLPPRWTWLVLPWAVVCCFLGIWLPRQLIGTPRLGESTMPRASARTPRHEVVITVAMAVVVAVVTFLLLRYLIG